MGTPIFKALADETRLKSILLIHDQQELCVCELMTALDESQPKISRHLAQLKKVGLLSDRRQGQWVFYRINLDLCDWELAVVQATAKGNQGLIAEGQARLNKMGDRPERVKACC
ncbi:metalloregulator ArsR/SmtB family transcription factor [Shewanella colwelliana]|uniref:Transcriptional regulator n=1 Tax=Shewanella colwelliana TaxID=23 RepID=A0ABQ4NVE1_SHECO|nr:metalloregulator ArsR/SmtB family transcription factor [Shewanella colwelliana]MDX1282596.1 metalloregulator ArsR/SmtB family transcription factor [Shewanella colwelliana]GIU36651.1 transcriptional regulator [Shewanella colwelliana]